MCLLLPRGSGSRSLASGPWIVQSLPGCGTVRSVLPCALGSFQKCACALCFCHVPPSAAWQWRRCPTSGPPSLWLPPSYSSTTEHFLVLICLPCDEPLIPPHDPGFKLARIMVMIVVLRRDSPNQGQELHLIPRYTHLPTLTPLMILLSS